MTAAVEIIEVGPRDGLQNEKHIVKTADKLRLINKLAAGNLSRIEVAACVSAKKVPQMADAAAVIGGLPKGGGVCYSALVPNHRGLQTALAADTIGEIAVFTGASESFVKKNINCTIDESIQTFAPIIAAAKKRGLRVRGYLSTAIVCPYQGAVSPSFAAEVAARLFSIGCDEISLADTIGGGKPEDVRKLLRETGKQIPMSAVAGHFHDTGGAAIDNIAAALECGVVKIDAAIGGLGGCPFAPGAPGNVATEKVARFLHRRGITTGIDEDKLARAAEFIRAIIGG
ncbi:MAG: hydroxymethylglutaryl-CoA lyase [Gammaproteobacteria bacterium]